MSLVNTRLGDSSWKSKVEMIDNCSTKTYLCKPDETKNCLNCQRKQKKLTSKFSCPHLLFRSQSKKDRETRHLTSASAVGSVEV